MNWGIEWKEFFFLISCPKQKPSSRALSKESSLHTKLHTKEKLSALPPVSGRCRHSRKVNDWAPLGAPHHIPLQRRA